MPLPDAKPSTRIYELLKTTDLENITFSQFQGVAEKIFAEQGAEDELRRIVLINLARLSVVGEWTGLTSAGGSSGTSAQLLDLGGWTAGTIPGSSVEVYSSSPAQAYAKLTDRSFDISAFSSYYHYFPITIRSDGDYSSFSVLCTTFSAGGAFDGAFYSVDEYGRPKDQLGTYSKTVTANGDVPVTITETSTGSMTLSANDSIWMAIKSNGTSVYLYTLRAYECNLQGYNKYTGSTTGQPYNALLSDSVPTTFAESDLRFFAEQDQPVIFW